MNESEKNKKETKNYLTGLVKTVKDENGTHTNAIHVAKEMRVRMYAPNPDDRNMFFSYVSFRNDELFQQGLNLKSTEQVRHYSKSGVDYDTMNLRSPVSFAIIAHLIREEAKAEFGFETATEIPLPEYLQAPEIQALIQAVKDADAAVSAQIQAALAAQNPEA